MQFQNPSIAEFIERLVSEERAWHEAIASRASFFLQISWLVKWAEAMLARTDSRRPQVHPAFWQSLHEGAALVETQQAGRLIRGVANVQYTENDGMRPIERTFVQLRILLHHATDDAQAREIKARVETVSGWTELLSDASLHSSIPYTATQIIERLLATSGPLVNLIRLQEAFSQATLALLAEQETWPAGLGDLAQLAHCMKFLNLNNLQEHAAHITRIATHTAAEVLEHEQNVAVLEDSARGLEDLYWLAHVNATSLADGLRERASEIASRQAHAAVEDARRSTPRMSHRPPELLDLEGMFAALLER